MLCVPFLLAAIVAQENPQFQVDVNLVTVAATVRNASGALVTNLAKEDFEVLENGVPQTIRVFGRQSDLPLSLGLILDVSGSQDKFTKRHRRDLEAFLNTVLQPRDRAFLICFGNSLRLVSDFSNSAGEIIDNLESFEDDKGSFPKIGPKENRVLGTALFDAIYYSVEEKLSSERAGRRAIIVFSDGEENASGHDLLDTIESAQRADTVVYGIRYTGQDGHKMTVRNRYGMRVLHHLSEHSGGADFDAMQKGMREAFKAIGEELRSTYELGYIPSNPDRDGDFRKIKIRVKRDGLMARSKPGYYAR